MIVQENANDPLFSDPTLMLGKIHWVLLRAANLMDAHRFREVEGQRGFSTTEWTEFGNEVGTDEISWWVFKKETEIGDLKAETERALKAAQILKTASAKLENIRPSSYGEILSTLRGFAEKHRREIESMYAYVRWLEIRDPMAPKILFTYRVWGSTRMSDRWIKLPLESPSVPDTDSMRICTELVLGLRDNLHSTYERVHNQLCFEIWESMDPEQIYEATRISVPDQRVLALASRVIFRECAIYFAEIRDSLRNVLIDIEKLEDQRELIHSDRFWREFTLKAIGTEKAEPQLWDFKETLTMWHVNKQAEKDRAKVDFAEDVASLANTTGGVLLVGIRDRPHAVVGLSKDFRELENRLKVARDAIANHIEYERDIVVFHQVKIPSKADSKLCLVIIVAQARDAVGVHDGQQHYTYPVRRETGIDRISRNDVVAHKVHVKTDNYNFMRDLIQFLRDN